METYHHGWRPALRTADEKGLSRRLRDPIRFVYTEEESAKKRGWVRSWNAAILARNLEPFESVCA